MSTPDATTTAAPGAGGDTPTGGASGTGTGAAESPVPSPSGAVLGAVEPGPPEPSPATGSTDSADGDPSQVSGLVVRTTAVRPALVASVTDLDHVAGGLDVIGTNLLLALILLLSIGLTSALFNATLEENRSEIETWFGRVSGRVTSLAAPLVLPTKTGFSRIPRTGRAGMLGRLAAILLLTALIYEFLSPDFGLDGRGLLLFLALLIGLEIVTYLSEGGSVLISGLRLHAPAGVRIYGAALVIAIASVMISRVIDFKPGVLYGFVASAVLLAPVSLERRQRAEIVLVPTVLLLAASMAAWLLLLPLRAAGQAEASWPLGLLEAVAAIVFVAGLEGALLQHDPDRLHGRCGHRQLESGCLGRAVRPFRLPVLAPAVEPEQELPCRLRRDQGDRGIRRRRPVLDGDRGDLDLLPPGPATTRARLIAAARSSRSALASGTLTPSFHGRSREAGVPVP